MRAASDEYGWNLRYGDIAMIFRGGCIIRAGFLQNIKDAYDRNRGPDATCCWTNTSRTSSNRTKALGEKSSRRPSRSGIPVPAFSSALAYYDSYRTERLPANLLQAQRDYFGAHTFKRVDKEGTFHFNWIQS